MTSSLLIIMLPSSMQRCLLLWAYVMSAHFSLIPLTLYNIWYKKKINNISVYWVEMIACCRRTVYSAEYCFMEIGYLHCVFVCVSFSFWVHVCVQLTNMLKLRYHTHPNQTKPFSARDSHFIYNSFSDRHSPLSSSHFILAF